MRIILLFLLIGMVVPTAIAQEDVGELECLAAPPSYAAVGQNIFVRDNDGRDLNLRSGPSSMAPIAGVLSPGDNMTITGGPQCGDGNNLYLWWEVTTEDGRTGWVAEGDSFNSPFLYFIATQENSVDIDATIVASSANGCVAAPPSKARVGDILVVGENGGYVLNMRSGPSTRGRVLRRLTTGSLLIVEDGPWCGEGNRYYVWWRVRAEDGMIGWIAEGDSTQRPIRYFVLPVTEARENDPQVLGGACRAAPPNQLVIGKTAIIGENGGFVLRLRNEPATFGTVITNLTTGTIVKVIDGPQCGLENRLYSWWQVELPDGRRGWVAEGDSWQNPDIYFLEPLRAQG